MNKELEPITGELLIKKTGLDIFYSYLFSFFAGLFLIDLINRFATRIYFAITKQDAILSSIYWGDLLSINLLKIILTSLVIFACSILFSYLYKKSKYWMHFILGFLIAYFIPVIIFASTLVIGIIRGEGLNTGLDSFFLSTRDIDLMVTLFIIQLIFIGIASKFGKTIGERLIKTDENDINNSTVYGIKRFTWFLLSFPLNLYLILAFEIIFRSAHTAISTLFSMEFWHNIFTISHFLGGEGIGVTDMIILPIIGFAIAWGILAIFSYGLKVIKNKNEKYRILKIIGIFIILPTVLFIIIVPG